MSRLTMLVTVTVLPIYCYLDWGQPPKASAQSTGRSGATTDALGPIASCPTCDVATELSVPAT